MGREMNSCFCGRARCRLPFCVRCRFAVLLLALFVRPSFSWGEVIEVDVGAWATVGTGETNGWTVVGISSTQDGLTRLKEKDDYALSPEYGSYVTQVVMKVLCSSATTDRYLTISPTIPETGAARYIADRCEKLTEQVFAWDSDDGVRQFRLQNDMGSGNTSWGIAALTVYTDQIAAPADLRSTSSHCDAFTASWTPDARAVLHEVGVSRVAVTPPRYDVVSEWNFTALTNDTRITRNLSWLQERFPRTLANVDGENLCLQAEDGGHLQIGMSKTAGTLELPLAEAAAVRKCLFTAWRHPSDGASGCAAFCLDENGQTNAEVKITAAADPVTDEFDIPSGSVRLRVESPKSRRIEVESVIVATNYIAGFVSTNFWETYQSPRAERIVKGLSPGEWVWAVRSFDAEGCESPWSPFCTVILDPLSPRYPLQGFLIQIR